MNREEIVRKITGILNDNYLSDLPENVSEETTFEELNLDSLDRIELVMLIDEGFGIYTDDRDWEDSETIKDAVEIIQKYLNHADE